jgi:hypothetical protein
MSANLVQNNVSGIYSSRLIVKTAIEAALNDIRKNSWLLDWATYQLIQDPLTKDTYGQAECDRAKNWFLQNEIKVVQAYQLNENTIPCISVNLTSSVEEISQLGDVDANPIETFDAVTPGAKQPNILAGPLTAAYNPDNGWLTIPATSATYFIFPGAVIIDQTLQVGYTIIDVIDQQTFVIVPALVNANFTNTIIVPSIGQNNYIQSIESVHMKDTFALGVHCYSDSFFCEYLYDILMMILYRYKQEFFEKRGFERTTVSAGDFRPWDTGSGQVMFERYVNLVGVCVYSWVKHISAPITGVLVYDLKILAPTPTPAAYLPQVYRQSWTLSKDKPGPILK